MRVRRTRTQKRKSQAGALPGSDPLEETAASKEDGDGRPLNTWVAAAVVLLACFMGVFSVKAGNIAQEMIRVKAEEVDYWNYFQAKSTKENLAEVARNLILAQRGAAASADSSAAAALRRQEEFYAAEIRRYESEKEEQKKKAESLGARYEDLNSRDDQFDLTDAVLSLALALYGITALTQRRWLFWVATGLAGCGLLLGLAGLANLDIHPRWLTDLLGT